MTDAAPPTQPNNTAAEHKAEFATARNIYFIVFGTFIAICAVAIIMTTQQESQKSGFRAIETDQPMLFFDKTYTKKSPSSTQPVH